MGSWNNDRIIDRQMVQVKEQRMNRRIKKKKLKQRIKNNVKITYSIERLDNGYCKLYAIVKGQEHE